MVPQAVLQRDAVLLVVLAEEGKQVQVVGVPPLLGKAALDHDADDLALLWTLWEGGSGLHGWEQMKVGGAGIWFQDAEVHRGGVVEKGRGVGLVRGGGERARCRIG